jgi:streptogramin lyase
MRGLRILLAAVPVVALAVAAAVVEAPGASQPTSCVTYFKQGLDGHPGGLTTGPEGNLWWTEVIESRIGKLDPKTGKVTAIQLPPGSGPRSPIFTPDGKLWFTGLSDRIGSYDPSTGKISFFTKGITKGSVPLTPVAPGNGYLYFTEEAGLPAVPLHGIIKAPDGTHLWIARQDTDELVRFDLRTQRFDGRVIHFPKGSGPHDIRLGPNETILTTLQHDGSIGEADLRTGRVRQWPTDLPPDFTPDHQPAAKLVDMLVALPKNAAYATSFLHNQLYKFDLTTHKLTEPVCGSPSGGSSLEIVLGPDGKVWYADPIGGRIVRVDREVTRAVPSVKMVSAG